MVKIEDRMASALLRAAIWFRGYEASHKAKGTHDGDIKAKTNAERAAQLEALVDEYSAIEPDEDAEPD